MGVATSHHLKAAQQQVPKIFTLNLIENRILSQIIYFFLSLGKKTQTFASTAGILKLQKNVKAMMNVKSVSLLSFFGTYLHCRI